ncbi:MAG: TrmH family RNA methyltransferase [Armatimonadota bacterium]
MITSRQNQHVRLFRALAQRRFRQREGKFTLDGVLQVAEAADCGFRLERVLFCRRLLVSETGRSLLDRLPADVPRLEVSEHVFRALTDRAEPQGIAAIAALPRRSLADVQLSDRPLVAALEDIRDPGNLGAIVRTAHATKADAVVTLGHSVDAFGPKAVRAAMGSLFHVPVIASDLSEFRRWARASRLRIVAAATDAARPYDRAPMPDRVALLLGNEARGLSEEALATADESVTIPMPGGTDSLNAAVAAGVLMYEVLRRRAATRDKGSDGEE